MTDCCKHCVDFMGSTCGNPMTARVDPDAGHFHLKVTADTPACGFFREAEDYYDRILHQTSQLDIWKD